RPAYRPAGPGPPAGARPRPACAAGHRAPHRLRRLVDGCAHARARRALRRFLAGGALDRQAAYWKAALAGVPTLLNLPTDRPRPAEQDYRGQFVPVEIDAELT